MEILGRNIPTLQNAIASGLESVRAGIAESAKASGVAALGIAQDSFSFEQIGTTSSADLPAVSGTAEYPNPDQYFRRFPGTASDSPISSLAISKTLSDPSFNAPKSLQTFSILGDSFIGQAVEQFNKAVGDATKYMNNSPVPPIGVSPGTLLNDPELDEKIMKDARLGDIFSSDVSRKAIGTALDGVNYRAVNRFGRDQSDAASVNTDGSYPATDRFGRDKSDAATVNTGGGSMVDSALKLINAAYEKQAEFIEKKQKPIEEKMKDFQNPRAYRAEKRFTQDKSDATSVEIGSDYPATDRFGRDKVEGTSMKSAAAGGSSDAASNRSIIVVGGKPDASDRGIIVVGGKTDASDRSIIVVGGKTSGTYFQTIDDSLTQLQKNPTPETSTLFTQQFSAVKDMVSTVAQTVQFQQTIASNRFTSLR